YPPASIASARSRKDSNGGMSQPSESASRTIMLKRAQMRIASTSPSSETPVARTAAASVCATSPARRNASSRYRDALALDADETLPRERGDRLCVVRRHASEDRA